MKASAYTEYGLAVEKVVIVSLCISSRNESQGLNLKKRGPNVYKLSVLSNTNDYKLNNGMSECATIRTKTTAYNR